jgi:hypothetical protein
MSTSSRGTRGTLPSAVVISALIAGLVLTPASAEPTARAAERTFGRTEPGTTFGFPGSGYKYGSRFVLGEPGLVRKLTAHMRGRLSGRAGAGETQEFRMMIYAADAPGGNPGTLLATSAERVLADNAPESNYTFALEPGVSLQPGAYWLMQQSGSTDKQVGLSEVLVPPGNQRFNLDLYGDGPSNPAGGVRANPKEYTMFATYVPVEQAGVAGARMTKILICHSSGTKWQRTLSIPTSTLRGHLAHGDHRGACS